MDRLDANVLRLVYEQAGIPKARIARALERPYRTIATWFTNDPVASRNVTPGEIERLCMLIDPLGERQDIIGWVVIAARARYAASDRTRKQKTAPEV